jgi:hypothetical protein
MAVREGAPKPDISPVDAWRRTLLAAKSIVYPDSASGVYTGSELLWRLGIEGRVESKSRMIPAEQFASVLANSEAEIGFQQVVELLLVKGGLWSVVCPPSAEICLCAHPNVRTSAQDNGPADTPVERTVLKYDLCVQ